MKDDIKFILFCLWQVIRHPRQRITIIGNPSSRLASQIPWLGSLVVLIIGIVCVCISAHYQITDLREAGKAMIYLPLGSFYGLATNRKK
jgi:hypothetical protein